MVGRCAMVCVVAWLDDVCEVVQTRGKCGAWHSFKVAPSCPLPLIQGGTKWPPRWPALAQADTSGPKLAPHGHQVGPSWPKLPHTIPELAQVRTQNGTCWPKLPTTILHIWGSPCLNKFRPHLNGSKICKTPPGLAPCDAPELHQTHAPPIVWRDWVRFVPQIIGYRQTHPTVCVCAVSSHDFNNPLEAGLGPCWSKPRARLSDNTTRFKRFRASHDKGGGGHT